MKATTVKLMSGPFVQQLAMTVRCSMEVEK